MWWRARHNPLDELDYAAEISALILLPIAVNGELAFLVPYEHIYNRFLSCFASSAEFQTPSALEAHSKAASCLAAPPPLRPIAP